MRMTKLRSVQPMLLASLIATGAGVLAFPSLAADQPIPSGSDKRTTKDKTGDELASAKFETLHSLIRPDPTKSFECVPWMTSLWEARKKAAAEDKPIVLWAGDPLPLGIT